MRSPGFFCQSCRRSKGFGFGDLFLNCFAPHARFCLSVTCRSTLWSGNRIQLWVQGRVGCWLVFLRVFWGYDTEECRDRVPGTSKSGRFRFQFFRFRSLQNCFFYRNGRFHPRCCFWRFCETVGFFCSGTERRSFEQVCNAIPMIRHIEIFSRGRRVKLDKRG